MCMPKPNKLLSVAFLLSLALPASAQVFSPTEIKDQAARQLQQSYISQLRTVAGAIQAQTFPYPFFLSRVLDVDQKQMARADQRSIRFDRYNSQTLLMITGNYYVSYAADQVNANERIHKTLDDVVRPMLQSVVSQFANIDGFDGYAFEISYHVRQKAMGMRSENAENVVFIFPRKAAQHLTGAANDEQLQAAILESKVFLDAELFTLWVSGERPAEEEIQKRQSVASADHKTTVEGMSLTAGSGLPSQSSVSHESVNPAERVILPETLSSLKLSYAGKILDLQRQLDTQAHFVSYAPPEFIQFHGAIFLEFSVNTSLDTAAFGSRYKLAALTFDEHISHLIRPTLAYFQDTADFDGLVFSTTIQQPGKSNSIAVEFFLPFPAIKCYAQYDCSGQQLLDSGFVLINGERITLTLQVAEAEQVPVQP